MRSLAIACLLVAAATLPAQPPSRLDACLAQWEAGMTGLDSIVVQDLKRTDTDKDGTTRVLTGKARFLKPGYAFLRLDRQDNPNLYEQRIATPARAFDYRPQSKTVYVYELPPQGAGRLQNSVLALIGGLGAAEAKARFDLALSKENKGFVYIDIRPKDAADKREFVQAELVLLAADMRPRRLWFRAANDSQTTWDIPALDTTRKLTPADFTPPQPERGWKVETVRSEPPAK